MTALLNNSAIASLIATRKTMGLTASQVKFLDRIAMGEYVLVKDWRTRKALERRGLIRHNDATWKYPAPYYQLTDKGKNIWVEIVTSLEAKS